MKNITFALTACMLLNSLSALSQPGTLDTSFSGNGKRTKKREKLGLGKRERG